MFLKSGATVLLSLFLGACATQAVAPGNIGARDAAYNAPAKSVEAANSLVRQARVLVTSKHSAQALPLLDQAIPVYERAYRRDDVLAYSARSMPETLFYALQGHEKNTSARVYGAEWGLAYFLKGFALIDLQRVAEAKPAYEAAIALSPRNSQFLAERAHIHAIERDWTKSFIAFEKALEATEFSPSPVKNRETARALRGMAFAQVELGNLDAAKALHERVLQMDANDPISRKELIYIEGLKNRPSPSPARR